MAVLKSKREESNLEVFSHFLRLRKDISDLMLKDFGYNKSKSEKRLSRMFGNKEYKELNDDQKHNYDMNKSRNDAFNTWFIADEREEVMECMRKIGGELYAANSYYPTCAEELNARRLHQDEAVANCHRLINELQYIAETLPINNDQITKFVEKLDKEIDLIKAWRLSNKIYNN